MKIYNAVGYSIVALYALACMAYAPPHIGALGGLVVGAVYFLVCWFMGGLYLSSVIHMGIAHRALDYQEWIIARLHRSAATRAAADRDRIGGPAPRAPVPVQPTQRPEIALGAGPPR